MGNEHLISLTCPNCGATLSVPAGDKAQPITCNYCEHHFVYEPGGAAAAPPAPPVPRPPVPKAARAGARVAFVVVPLLGIGIVLAIYHHASSPSPFMWDQVGGAPIAVKIAGQEAVCGRIRALPGSDQLSILCTDARTRDPRWRFGPLGTYSEAYRATHFAAVAGRMAVSDLHAKIHLLDTETGKERGTVAVTDRVEQLCVDGPHTVFALVSDHRNVEVDVTTGTMKEQANTPPGCEEFVGMSAPQQFAGPPAVAGFAPHSVLVDGDVAVMGGYKAPGTAYPMAVGFDPGTRAVRWTVQVGTASPASIRERSNNHTALAAGRYVTLYGAGLERWRVAAYDARAGTPLWDVGLRAIVVDTVSAVVATDEFIYVVRASSLDVLDAKTGHQVGAIGDEHYQ